MARFTVFVLHNFMKRGENATAGCTGSEEFVRKYIKKVSKGPDLSLLTECLCHQPINRNTPPQALFSMFVGANRCSGVRRSANSKHQLRTGNAPKWTIASHMKPLIASGAARNCAHSCLLCSILWVHPRGAGSAVNFCQKTWSTRAKL